MTGDREDCLMSLRRPISRLAGCFTSLSPKAHRKDHSRLWVKEGSPMTKNKLRISGSFFVPYLTLITVCTLAAAFSSIKKGIFLFQQANVPTGQPVPTPKN